MYLRSTSYVLPNTSQSHNIKKVNTLKRNAKYIQVIVSFSFQ